MAFHIADFGDWGYIDRKMSLYRLHGGGIYSPLPAHHQDLMLLKQMKSLYSERTYRVRYNDIIRAKLCHYSMTVARAYRSTSRFRYVKHLAEYVLYHPRPITAFKVILSEEILQLRAKENKVK